MTDRGPDDVLVLEPTVVRAAVWTLLGAAVVGVTGWAVATTASRLVSTVAGFALLAAVPVTGWFAVQTLAPRAWTLRLGRDRLQGWSAGRAVDVDLRDVLAMRVGRVWGEPALVVRTAGGERALPLPVGVDAHDLDRELDARRSGVPTARPFAP